MLLVVQRHVGGDDADQVALLEHLGHEQQRGRLDQVVRRRQAFLLEHQLEAMAQHAARRRHDPALLGQPGQRQARVIHQRMAGAHHGGDRLLHQRLVAQVALVVAREQAADHHVELALG